MRMRTKSNSVCYAARATFGAILLLCVSAVVTTAQNSSTASDAEREAGENYHHSFVSAEFAFTGRVRRGAPYSASAEKETTQMLADGTRIVRRASVFVYRDSEGRTRQDRFPPDGKQTALRAYILNDPVAGAFYFIAPQRNIATKFSFGRAADSQRVATSSNDPAAIVGGRTERLGTRIIEGVEAEGVRTTTEIAAGEIGNARPVTIIYERWYASTLDRDVLIKCSDTRFGEAFFRLTNISRNEPAPNLFAVPPATQIHEATFAKPRRASD